MVKKCTFLLFFIFFTNMIFPVPLDSRNVANCLSIVRDFTDDYRSYYNLYMEIGNVTGRVRDNNQTNIERKDNNISINILFNNEVMFRIIIEKTASKGDDDGIDFDYSNRTGFRTIYRKSYDMGNGWDIEYILSNIFEALGL
ncbi:MAG: hypothetical protein FWH35_00840 [Treponema sp.]|nr:hypothetical protein [Treponema sp.]